MVARFDATTVIHRNLLHDGQTEAAAAASRTGPGWIASVKALKHAAKVGVAQSRTMVTDAEQPPATTGNNRDIHAGSVGGIPQGVIQQIEHRPVQSPLITHHRPCFGSIQIHRHLAFLRQGTDAGPGTVHQILKGDGGVTAALLGQAVLQARQLQQVLHHQLQPPQLPLQALHQHGVSAVHSHLKPVADQHQGRQRCLQLVGHIADPALLLLLLRLQ